MLSGWADVSKNTECCKDELVLGKTLNIYELISG
jgi:hypothetical protein